jgi:hypothetical protein
MVKRQKKDTSKKRFSKGFKATDDKARKINASTSYETCTEQLSPFGVLLAMIKFLDLIKFCDIFHAAYICPKRKPKLGNYFMVVGILMLLFIGFNRLWHFTYVRLDAILCGFFRKRLINPIFTGSCRCAMIPLERMPHQNHERRRSWAKERQQRQKLKSAGSGRSTLTPGETVISVNVSIAESMD